MMKLKMVRNVLTLLSELRVDPVLGKVCAYIKSSGGYFGEKMKLQSHFFSLSVFT